MEPEEKSKISASTSNGSLIQSDHPADTKKHGRKEHLLRHAREILAMILYLAVSFSLLATFRCLVLIQNGINDFTHSYVVAIALSFALGKIVVLAQNLPIVTALNHKPVIWSVLYKAVLLTLIADAACFIEAKVFHHDTQPALHPLALMVTHQIALMCIFLLLFTWRDLDRALGKGTLPRLFFQHREPA